MGRIKVDCTRISRTRFLIAASEVQCDAKVVMAASVKGVQRHRVAGGGDGLLKLTHVTQELTAHSQHHGIARCESERLLVSFTRLSEVEGSQLKEHSQRGVAL